MTGGQRFEYLWQDGVQYKKPTQLTAPEYITLLIDWVESKVNDETCFPVDTSIPFPRNFQPMCKKILSRLYRIFVHVYIHHFDRLRQIGAEPHANTCYKHFYYFVTEFNLIDSKELEPLKEMTQRLIGRENGHTSYGNY